MSTLFTECGLAKKSNNYIFVWPLPILLDDESRAKQTAFSFLWFRA